MIGLFELVDRKAPISTLLSVIMQDPNEVLYLPGEADQTVSVVKQSRAFSQLTKLGPLFCLELAFMNN